MSVLHETSIGSAQKTIGYGLSILASLMIFIPGFLKFTPNAWAVEPLEKLGLSDYTLIVGIIEIFIVILYWIPRFSNIGFFLICSYVGGVIVGELLMPEIPIPGMTIGLFTFLGTLLRKPSLTGISSKK